MNKTEGGTFVPALFLVLDGDGKVSRSEFVRPDFSSLFPKELNGKKLSEVVPGPAAGLLEQAYIQALNSGLDQEIRFNLDTAAGPIWLEAFILLIRAPSNTNDRVMLISRDITERRREQQALKESESHFRNLMERAGDPIFVIDTNDNRIVDCNNRAVTSYGYSPDEFSRLTVFDIEVKVGRGEIEAIHSRVKSGIDTTVEGIHKRKDGSTFPVEIRFGLLQSDQPRMIIAIVRDITERRIAENELRESEERYRGLFNVESDAIILTDMDTLKVVDVNPAAVKLYGYNRDAFVGMELTKISTEPEKTQQAVKKGDIHIKLRWHRRKDGDVFPVEITGGAYDYQGRRIHFGVIREISDRLKSEEERRELEGKEQQLQKLESLGILAGGIAHDFNNMLFGLFGYIERAREAYKRGALEKIGPALDQAGTFLKRARDLTQQLLTFARGGAPVKNTVNLGPLVQQAASFALSGSNIRMETEFPAGLWRCELDENQISQVIDNLARNAREAMPTGGTLSIKAENLDLSSGPPTVLTPGKYVHVSVKDYGYGIPNENLQRIFDPFFTTKEKGHGLGLSMAYSIVKRHGGHIEAESVVGQGATFHIYLPASERFAVENHEEKRLEPRGRGRILVMDDEKGIVELAKEMLEEMGYFVEGALSGEEAVALYQKALTEERPFDAVILDLTVRGGMGGKEALETLQRIDPAVKAVVSSGYATDPIISAPQEYGFKDTLAKPYRLQDMAEVIGRVIRGN